jgi:hypothetical protein
MKAPFAVSICLRPLKEPNESQVIEVVLDGSFFQASVVAMAGNSFTVLTGILLHTRHGQRNLWRLRHHPDHCWEKHHWDGQPGSSFKFDG